MRHLRAVVCGIILAWAAIAQAETCVWLDRVDENFDGYDIMMAPIAITVAGVACHCQGTCTAPLASFALTDRAGNAITLASTLTCSSGTANSTWVDTSGGARDLIAGEGLEVNVSNVPASFDRYTICVRFS